MAIVTHGSLSMIDTENWVIRTPMTPNTSRKPADTDSAHGEGPADPGLGGDVEGSSMPRKYDR